MKYINTIFFAMLFAVSLYAGNFTIEQLSLNEGVTHSSVYSIYQDSNGVIWFGTMFGLVKYDGYEYEVFRHDPDDSSSIGNDDIISITEDAEGYIWCGTYGGGVSRLEHKTGTFVNYSPGSTGLSEKWDGIAWGVLAASDGYVYIGTTNSGVIRLNPVDSQLTVLSGEEHSKPSNGQIYHIYEANNDKILAFDSNGKIFIIDNDNVTSLQFEELKLISDVTRTYDGNYIISGNRLLYNFNPVSQKIIPIEISRDGGEILHFTGRVVTTSDGDYWLATRDGLFLADNKFSINQFIPKKSKNHPDSRLQGAPIIKMICDNSGVLWVSSYGSGVSKIYPGSEAFTGVSANKLEQAGFKGTKVWALTSIESSIYFGTSTGLGRYIDGAIEKITYKEFENFPVADIQKLNEHSLLLASGNKILRYEIPSGIIEDFIETDFSANITGILALNDETQLIGTDIGLYSNENGKLQKWASKSETADGILGNSVISLNIDSEGRYWIGTYFGVTIYNPADASYKYLAKGRENSSNFPNNYLFSFLEVEENLYLLGTAGGLVLYDETNNNLSIFTKKDGLPNSVIAAITESGEQQKYLITTHKGISLFNLHNKSFENFSTDDGLANNLFNKGSITKIENYMLAAGGMNGFDIINPEHIAQTVTSKKISITQLSSSEDVYLSNKNEVVLNNDEDNFTIVFNTFDYKIPERKVFLYRLAGADSSFKSISGKNKVSYSSVKPGKYTFEIKEQLRAPATYSDSESLIIIVQPPFYAQWWFLSGAGFLLTGFIFLGHNEHLSRKMCEIEKINKIREEEGNRIRKKAAADFHDELGHKLTKIALYSELLKRNTRLEHNETDLYLDRIVDLSAGLSSGVRDFIWNLDPDKNTLFDLYARLKDFGDELFDRTGIIFRADGINPQYSEIKLTMDFRRHLTLMVKESLNNVLKHSHAEHAELQLQYVDGSLILTVKDDGKGFDISKAFNGNGLKSMKQRSVKLGGNLKINSDSGGTEIIFTSDM